MRETYEAVVNAREESEEVVDLPECPLASMRRAGADVVMHYKCEMDDKHFIPAYAEGVQWYLRTPEGVPK